MMQADMFADSVKQDFVARLLAGQDMDCPCCGRYAKIYKRTIHKGIALQLIKLYRAGGENEYIHITEFCTIKGGMDVPIARFWGLIEHRINEDDSKRDSGCWRLTPLGVLFVQCRAKVPKYALLYDNKKMGMTGADVDIRACLGNKFNYTDLMNDAA